jgi:hypothetical protein
VILGATSTQQEFHIGLVATAFGFGFRHGIDWDHIAALTDITGSQNETRRSMVLATFYALGHALVVFILGFAAVVLAERLPPSVDSAMERIVGVTLLALGVYVFCALVRQGRDFRMQSRWMLLFSALRRSSRRLRSSRGQGMVIDHAHEHSPDEVHGPNELVHVGGGPSSGSGHSHRHRHQHLGVVPDDPFMQYGRSSVFAIGMIHGVGAETPTQLLIFLAAAGAAGRGAGLLLLGCFLVGLLSSNTFVALAGTFGFLGATRNFKLYVAVSIVTAAVSVVIGSVFVLGHSATLPALFGG